MKKSDKHSPEAIFLHIFLLSFIFSLMTSYFPHTSHIFFSYFLHIFSDFFQSHEGYSQFISQAKKQRSYFISSPHTSLRSVLRQQAVFEGGSSLEYFQVPEPRKKLWIFRSPRADTEETVRRMTPRFTWCLSNRLYVKGEERSEFFKVPEPMYRRWIRNFRSPNTYSRNWQVSCLFSGVPLNLGIANPSPSQSEDELEIFPSPTAHI